MNYAKLIKYLMYYCCRYISQNENSLRGILSKYCHIFDDIQSNNEYCVQPRYYNEHLANINLICAYNIADRLPADIRIHTKYDYNHNKYKTPLYHFFFFLYTIMSLRVKSKTL